MKEHTREWFLKQELRLQEPLKNTKRYYYKSATVKIASVILMPFGIIELLKVRKNLQRFMDFKTDFMNNGRTVTNDGAPGVGKTFLGCNMAYYLAQEQWARLQSDYLTQRTMLAQWVAMGDLDKLTAFKALEESYNFYKAHEGEFIPCLVSSIPLKEYGTNRYSYKLTPEVYLQVERCPEYTVLFNDESGLIQGADTSKTAKKELLEFWRFHRHYFDGMSVNTNQDGGQNAIYMRRSTDYNNHIYGQEWLLHPRRLEKRIERKEQRFYKRISKGKLDEKRTQFIGQKLYFLKKYKSTIGFRRVTYKLSTPGGVALGDTEEIILPAIGGVQYDDRTFRNLYRCKDKPIKLAGWERLVVDDFDRAAYGKMTCDEGAGDS